MILLPGTYYDGVHGNANEKSVIKLALGEGWDDAEARAAQSQTPEEVEGWDNILEDAVRFLNTLTPAEYSFYSNENGDWGVYPTEPVEITTKDLSGKVLRVDVLPKNMAVRNLRELQLEWTTNWSTLTATGEEVKYEVHGLEKDDLAPDCTSE